MRAQKSGPAKARPARWAMKPQASGFSHGLEEEKRMGFKGEGGKDPSFPPSPFHKPYAPNHTANLGAYPMMKIIMISTGIPYFTQSLLHAGNFIPWPASASARNLSQPQP